MIRLHDHANTSQMCETQRRPLNPLWSRRGPFGKLQPHYTVHYTVAPFPLRRSCGPSLLHSRHFQEVRVTWLKHQYGPPTLPEITLLLCALWPTTFDCIGRRDRGLVDSFFRRQSKTSPGHRYRSLPARIWKAFHSMRCPCGGLFSSRCNLVFGCHALPSRSRTRGADFEGTPLAFKSLKPRYQGRLRIFPPFPCNTRSCCFAGRTLHLPSL